MLRLNKEDRRRLRKHLAFMSKLPEGKIYLNSWASGPLLNRKYITRSGAIRKDAMKKALPGGPLCGTVACVAGWLPWSMADEPELRGKIRLELDTCGAGVVIGKELFLTGEYNHQVSDFLFASARGFGQLSHKEEAVRKLKFILDGSVDLNRRTANLFLEFFNSYRR